MSANLLDGLTPELNNGTEAESDGTWHHAARTQVDRHDDWLIWELPSQAALETDQTYHVGLSVRGASAANASLRMTIGYDDAAGKQNWATSGALAIGTSWGRDESTITVPSGMRPFALYVAAYGVCPETWMAAPTLSLGSPVTLASSAHTPYATQDHLQTNYATNSALEQTSTEIQASVSDSLTQAKTYTDGQVETEVTNRNAAITESANEIKSEVSETYATQESLATTDAKADAAQTAANNAQSTADTAKEAASANTTDLTNYIESNDSALSQMQSQIDGSITTWFYDVAPTADNAPAKDWTTTDLKNNHLGDLYYDTVTGYCYRYQVLNNTYSWSRITDTDVTKALSDAAAAQDTADSKRRIFVNTPTPPYDVGDQWAQGTSGDILICSTAKASGQSYAASDWTKASKYTDDTAAAAAQSTADAAKSAAAGNASEIATIKTDYVTNSTFDQSNTEIKASVADTLTQAKTYTDGQVETEVTNRNAAITESANEIKSEVSETYATQDNLAAANSAITQNANAISSEVTARETTDSNVSTLSTKVTQNADSITTEIGDRESAVSTVDTKATTAQSTADAAKSAANKAQSTADSANTNLTTLAGKTGRVIYSSTEPTGDDANANNLWIDTDDGKLYTYSGSTWTLVTDTRLTSAANAASAAQSTADTAKANAATAQSTADDAKSAATTLSTLIRESSSGIDVGKSTDGSAYSTSVARVGSDGAFHILTSALVEVAKYAGNLIELGKNSTSAIIKFCGGLGEMGLLKDAETTFSPSFGLHSDANPITLLYSHTVSDSDFESGSHTAGSFPTGTKIDSSVAAGQANDYVGGEAAIMSSAVAPDGKHRAWGSVGLLSGFSDSTGTASPSTDAPHMFVRGGTSDGSKTSYFGGEYPLDRVGTAIQPVVLYNGGAALAYDTAPGSGTTDTVTLSETAANFRKIKIFYHDNHGVYGSTETVSPTTGYVSLSISSIGNGNSQPAVCAYENIHFNGTELLIVGYYRFYYSGGWLYDNSKTITIIRVEGIR
jgi:hypothetical protein